MILNYPRFEKISACFIYSIFKIFYFLLCTQNVFLRFCKIVVYNDVK